MNWRIPIKKWGKKNLSSNLSSIASWLFNYQIRFVIRCPSKYGNLGRKSRCPDSIIIWIFIGAIRCRWRLGHNFKEEEGAASNLEVRGLKLEDKEKSQVLQQECNGREKVLPNARAKTYLQKRAQLWRVRNYFAYQYPPRVRKLTPKVQCKKTILNFKKLLSFLGPYYKKNASTNCILGLGITSQLLA